MSETTSLGETDNSENLNLSPRTAAFATQV
jgi:hypothetical protein